MHSIILSSITFLLDTTHTRLEEKNAGKNKNKGNSMNNMGMNSMDGMGGGGLGMNNNMGGGGGGGNMPNVPAFGLSVNP